MSQQPENNLFVSYNFIFLTIQIKILFNNEFF